MSDLSDFIILWEIQEIKKLSFLIFGIKRKSWNKYLHFYTMYTFKIIYNNYWGKNVGFRNNFLLNSIINLGFQVIKIGQNFQLLSPRH